MVGKQIKKAREEKRRTLLSEESLANFISEWCQILPPPPPSAIRRTWQAEKQPLFLYGISLLKCKASWDTEKERRREKEKERKKLQ